VRGSLLCLSLSLAQTGAGVHARPSMSAVAPVPTSTSTTTSASFTSTTTGTIAGCSDVAGCLDHPHCRECIEEINNTAGFPHTGTEWFKLNASALRGYNVGFFHTLLSTASCSTNTTPPDLLQSALLELGFPPCIDAHGIAASTCLAVEYVCFADSRNCRECLASLYDATAVHGSDSSKAAALRSPACISTNATLLNELLTYCGGESFPDCSYYKQQCALSTECATCLTALGTGDGVGAARQCRGSIQSSALTMDSVVSSCMDSNAAACDFWRQRCADDVKCGACLAGIGNGNNAREIVASWWSTPACQRVAQDLFAVNYVNSITKGCPDISACRAAVSNCVIDYGEDCIACINGSEPPSPTTSCSHLLQLYSLDTECQPCPASVHTINSIVFATAMVGGTSATACILVATTIVAHGRDRVSMRDRVVVGLMISNALYSAANAIPLNALRVSVVDCGRHAMSFDAIRFGRALWFCGKYGLVSFELLILGASIHVLRGMSFVPPRTEATMHAACYAVAVAAFSVFYVLCARINADGYNVDTESEAYTNAYTRVRLDDDLDDSAPSIAASLAFQNARNAYDNLVRNMLVAWDSFVGVAVGMWVVLRVLHRRALLSLRTEATAAANAEAADVWRDLRRSVWGARRRLLEARQEAFNEVAKPLEPYIIVFVLFAAPAFVMSTPFCQEHSGASTPGDEGAAGHLGGDEGTDFTYRTCDVWCEFVLAFRSLAAVTVYLGSFERRAELVAVSSTWRKLCTRVVVCVRCAPLPHSPLVYELVDADQMDEVAVDHCTTSNNNSSSNNINSNNNSSSSTMGLITAAAHTSPWHINERDIVKVRRLGKGMYGKVYECVLHPDGRRVAAKFLYRSKRDVDADGNIVDAEKVFRKECEALQRVSCPHLIEFLGFGTTKSGKRFIVTELVTGGSLEDVLHDHERELPWRTRVSIGLQVALGMDHLHKRQLLHRDLKSANVLLDEELKAKVCDFGLARVVKPSPKQVVVRSAFTGVTRLLPSADSIEIYTDGQSALSTARAVVGIVDAKGTMTQSAGTLLWMAPEVFRGDRHYTCAVDVYSFGIVLWELATRKTPWVDEMPSNQKAFFEMFSLALQAGRRPAIPDFVRADDGAFVTVMQRCWAGDPVDRPTFADAAHELAGIINA
jgi:hypothetical protein